MTNQNNMKRNVIILLFGISAMAAGCRQSANQESTAPPKEVDDILLDKPENVSLNKDVLGRLVDSIRSGFYPNRHSLLIYKDGKLVSENYFSGRDNLWGKDLGVINHNDTVLHDMRSVSKSIVSACIGIAIAQGKIESIDQPVFTFFKEYEDFNNDGREEITIKHLLTMTSGLEWNEDVPYDNPKNSEIQMINSGDAIGYVLSRKLTDAPGTRWNYNGGNTELLAAIVKRTTGKDIYEFSKEYLFEPIGITKSEWTISPATNAPAAASGLRITSRDMLRFGILYLNGGKWGANQIVPKEWIEASFKSSISRPDGGGYGYQFWIFNYVIQGHDLTIPAAVGNGDERIFFDQKNGLLVVTTAGNYNRWDIENDASAVLEKVYDSFSVK